jgi:hypothetical protein
MATATSGSVAPADTSRSDQSLLRRWLPAAATIVGVAVAMRVIFDPWYLNYDARYALDWASDIWHGMNPDFMAQWAPTPHPLSIALSSLALPFGHSGDQLVVWLVQLGFGALVWLSYKLGATLFNRWAGVVVAIVVATRPALLRDTLLDYQDIWFEALIIGAVLLEAQRLRRGVPVLVVLGLAGLLRPEAWVLSGLYWLWLWPAATPRKRLLYAGIVAAAPVLWALMDLIVTGDALHSLHGTADLAIANERRLGFDRVPYWTTQYYGFTLRIPILVGIPIGLFFAWRFRLKQALLPLAAILAMTAIFAISPAFDLPLIGRYLRTPSVMIVLFYGLAVFGWMLVPRERKRERQVWMAIGALMVLASLVYLPKQIPMLTSLKKRADNEGALYSDLRKAGEARAVRAAFDRCEKLSTADHRPIPYLRWWLDADPFSINTIEPGYGPRRNLLLVPRGTRYAKRFYQENLPDVAKPAGWKTVYENRSYRVYAAPGCAT